MIASDCVIAWGEANIILSACMKENARAMGYISFNRGVNEFNRGVNELNRGMISIEVLTIRLLGRAVIFLGLL